MDAPESALTQLRALETVCCLECGEIYSKPLDGGTVQKNPGCPECGYVGWIPLSLPAEPTASRRPGEGRLRNRVARSH